jgi:hypothetical protein
VTDQRSNQLQSHELSDTNHILNKTIAVSDEMMAFRDAIGRDLYKNTAMTQITSKLILVDHGLNFDRFCLKNGEECC